MSKNLHRWLPAYLRQIASPRIQANSATRPALLLAVCDHFEPYHDADRTTALARTQRWRTDFPKLTSSFCDSAGRSPRHTFFYPIEQYDHDVLELLADLKADSGCEVEVHLHHNQDSEQNLRHQLRTGLENLSRHGHLSQDASGSTRFAFIHGNWALANCHPHGHGCGVPNELAILREEGCFADLTFPSAPHSTQPRVINTLRYVQESGSPASLNRGATARCGATRQHRAALDQLLMIHGPLGLNFGWRKFGVLPRIENGDLTNVNPPTLNRLRMWRKLCPQVGEGPAWQFVKLHTHGALPRITGMFLGEAMQNFHSQLAKAAQEEQFDFYYVTAREMVNVIHAAEDGLTGNPSQYFDYLFRKRARHSS